MKIYTNTSKAILGTFYPKNMCVDVPESQARFLIEKEGFTVFNEVEHKKKDIKEGGNK